MEDALPVEVLGVVLEATEDEVTTVAEVASCVLELKVVSAGELDSEYAVGAAYVLFGWILKLVKDDSTLTDV